MADYGGRTCLSSSRCGRRGEVVACRVSSVNSCDDECVVAVVNCRTWQEARFSVDGSFFCGFASFCETTAGNVRLCRDGNGTPGERMDECPVVLWFCGRQQVQRSRSKSNHFVHMHFL